MPLIAGGMVAWRAPPAVTVTALLTVDASWKPALLPVARTEISFPRSATLRAYVPAVAPLMVTPLRSHW